MLLLGRLFIVYRLQMLARFSLGCLGCFIGFSLQYYSTKFALSQSHIFFLFVLFANANNVSTDLLVIC